ncbi:MAG: ABC transporter ATP-binding protein [Sulfurimonas sp.]|jgi:branched-chain amino acid transport system ATP-binding protein
MSQVRTNALTKIFNGIKAVDDLSIEIRDGNITGIIGPNGSGKTTLVNILTGVIPFEKGSVIISETIRVKVKPFNIHAYGITRTFQAVRLFEQMSVLDNILVVLTERNVFSALFERHNRHHMSEAEAILKGINLWEKKDENVERLSYGQKKLLEIARAIAMKSEIYFFDEPFAGLFPEMRKIVTDIIYGLKIQDKTVVIIEHDIELIRRLCDRVIVMNAGTLLAEGRPEDVLKDKRVIEAYLGD